MRRETKRERARARCARTLAHSHTLVHSHTLALAVARALSLSLTHTQISTKHNVSTIPPLQVKSGDVSSRSVGVGDE